MYRKYLIQNYKKYYSGDKKNRRIRAIYFFITLFIISGAGFWLYTNYDSLLLYFQKNEHSYFEAKIDLIQKEIYQNLDFRHAIPQNISYQHNKQNNTQLYSSIKNLKKELEKAIQSNRIESNINFYKGKILWLEFLYSIRDMKLPYLNLVFYSIIDKDVWKKNTCFDCVENSITYIRRALALQLYPEYKIEATVLLAHLYFFLDVYRWKEGYQIITKLPNNFESQLKDKNKYYYPNMLLNLYSVVFPYFQTNWKSLEDFFPNQVSIDFLKGCRYFAKNNTPNAYSYFQKVIRSADKMIIENQDIVDENSRKMHYISIFHNYRNNALYLLGIPYKTFYKQNIQLSYYSLINLDFFLVDNEWFLEEITNLYNQANKKEYALSLFNEYRKKL